MKKWLKISLWIIAALVVTVVVLLSYLPTFLEDYIQENDLELIGREVEVENIDINYFTGKVGIENFKMREEDTSTVFVSFFGNAARSGDWSPFFKWNIHSRFHH